MADDRVKSVDARMLIDGAGVDRMSSRRLIRLLPRTGQNHAGAYPLSKATAYYKDESLATV
jgi:hypothetical protein